MGTYTESLNSRDNHGARRPRAVRGGLERESGEEPCGALFAGPECGLDPLGQHWKFTEFLSSRKPEGRQQSDRIEAGKPFFGKVAGVEESNVCKAHAREENEARDGVGHDS